MFPDLPVSYHPLSAFELMSSFQLEQRALPSPQEEGEAVLTRLRMNSKMRGALWFQVGLSPQNDDLAPAVYPGP